MPFDWSKRCGGCAYFVETVFKEESESGLGVWFGWCTLKPSERYGWMSRKRVLNVYHRCEDFQPRLDGSVWIDGALAYLILWKFNRDYEDSDRWFFEHSKVLQRVLEADRQQTQTHRIDKRLLSNS